MSAMNKKHYLLLILIGFILLACANEKSTPPIVWATPTKTSTPTYAPMDFSSTKTALHNSSVEFFLTQTAAIALSRTRMLTEEQERIIVELLGNNSHCKFPCFWEMEVGRTGWTEVERRFSDMAIPIFKEEKYLDDGLIQYQVAMPVSKEGASLSFNASFSVAKVRGIDVIERISLYSSSANETGFAVILPEYTPAEILKDMGIPDRVYISFVDKYVNMGYGFMMIYETKSKSVFDYSFYPDSNTTICPNYVQGDKTGGFNFFLSYPASPVNLFRSENSYLPPEKYPDYFRLIQDEIGLTPKQFYYRMLENPYQCFGLLSQTE